MTTKKNNIFHIIRAIINLHIRITHACLWRCFNEHSASLLPPFCLYRDGISLLQISKSLLISVPANNPSIRGSWETCQRREMCWEDDCSHGSERTYHISNRLMMDRSDKHFCFGHFINKRRRTDEYLWKLQEHFNGILPKTPITFLFVISVRENPHVRGEKTQSVICCSLGPQFKFLRGHLSGPSAD